MKKTIIKMILGAVALGGFSSCEDMMSPKSSTYLYDEDLSLNSPNDSLYSIVGLMTNVQQLGERYVLFGELRGDLMTVSPTAELGLQEISAFTPQTGNKYLDRSDFYAVINQCNWIISKMDPTVTVGTQQVLADEYAAAVVYRAWTYLQLGLAYGKVNWVTEPVLSLEGSEKDYPEVGLDELVRKLIAEVEPLAMEERPDYGMLDNVSSRNFFLVPSLFLADLYLYDGQYDNAARLYWQGISDQSLTVGDQRIAFASNTQRLGLETSDFTTTYRSETISEIPYSSSAKDFHPDLLNLSVNEDPALRPARWWIDDMASKTFYFGSKNYVAASYSRADEGGDLRGAVRYADGTWHDGGSVGLWAPTSGSDREMMISKYSNISTQFSGATTENPALGQAAGVTAIPLCRAPHVYLRFAEAVNRLGKPGLAYAVIRYGLSRETLDDETRVNPDELESGQPWLAWSDEKFDNNIGTAARGRGYGVAYPESVDEDLPAGMDERQLMLWVEDRIADELAAETAYEGNRFFDLARIARHRDDNGWFADRVSRRFDNQAAVRAMLLDRDNWFIR